MLGLCARVFCIHKNQNGDRKCALDVPRICFDSNRGVAAAV